MVMVWLRARDRPPTPDTSALESDLQGPALAEWRKANKAFSTDLYNEICRIELAENGLASSKQITSRMVSDAAEAIRKKRSRAPRWPRVLIGTLGAACGLACGIFTQKLPDIGATVWVIIFGVAAIVCSFSVLVYEGG